MPLLQLIKRSLASRRGLHPIFNEHHPRVASIRSWKWAGILLEVGRANQSGSNESMNLKKA